MKIMSRDFTTREKIMLLVLTLILLAAGYYAVIDQPIRTAINEAKSQQDELNTELMLLQTKAAERAGFHRTERKPWKNGKLQ